MKRLSLLRHAKADAESSGGDFDRSLSERTPSGGRLAKSSRLGVTSTVIATQRTRRRDGGRLQRCDPIFDKRIYDVLRRCLSGPIGRLQGWESAVCIPGLRCCRYAHADKLSCRCFSRRPSLNDLGLDRG